MGRALKLSRYLVHQQVWSSPNWSRPGFLDSMSTGTRVLCGSGVAPKAFLLKAWSLTFGPIRREEGGGGAYVKQLGHRAVGVGWGGGVCLRGFRGFSLSCLSCFLATTK